MKARALCVVLVLGASVGVALADGAAAEAKSPIEHVVIIDEENHSFNDLFGKYCVEQGEGQIARDGSNQGCVGTTTATLSTGFTYPITGEPDFGLRIDHSVPGQKVAIDGGKMDRFDHLKGCTSAPYGCLTQFDPLNGACGTSGTDNCLPNLDSYATHFAISDNTFEFRQTPSWAGHMILGSATIEHFKGLNPKKPGGAGWGCNSGKLTPWYTGGGNTGPTVDIPSCIPDSNGSLGPTWAGYAGTRATYVPTIFDRLDQASLPWRIYTGVKPAQASAGGWSICPTFWECLGSSQNSNVVSDTQFPTDAASGSLPAVSFVIPSAAQSAHQPASVSSGDNWVGSVVSSVMSSQAWGSTAIFITYDDCGCFYDPVNPLQYSNGWGVRVPMVVVSPYAKAGYTDSTPATFVSMLTFVEHTFGLTPLNPCASVDSWDPTCTDDAVDWNGQPTYDYSSAFDFDQTPLPGRRATTTAHTPAENAWLAAHPGAGDEAT